MKNILRIIRLSRPLYKKILLLSGFVFAMSIVQQIQPFFLKFIVDDIELQITSGTGDSRRMVTLMAGMLIVNLSANLLNSINMRFGDYINSRVRKFLTERFYSKIFTLPQRYFDSEISGKILNQLNRGIDSIQQFMGMSTNFILPAMFQAIFTVGILMYYDLLIGIIALAVFPVYILISSYSTRRWGKEEIRKNKIEDVSRGRIHEVINNIRLVRGFMMQAREWRFVSEKLKEINVIYDQQSTAYHIINFFREFGVEAALLVVSLMVFKNTFNGVFTLGEMVLILQFLYQMRRPLFAMSFILERIQQAESGSKEFFEVMGLESSEKVNMKSLSRKRIDQNPSLRFEDVTFEYDTDKGAVLRNLSFEIPAKQTVALVGHSGAGKSTIINLILKYYSPTKGETFLGDKPYSELTHQEVRSHISLVFQDSELFSTTVRDNVAYGISKAKEEDIISALRKANAYDFVMKLPRTLDEEIGERGIKLSGGQKQRIQIARAIMHNAPILILDEATSNLDSRSEKQIQEALEALMKDKLVIIIAHRFSTIQNADQILVIDDGKLVDAGQPGDLAKREGIYSELLKYQIEGNQKLLEKYELH